jgi:lysophospholipase L1-like esterase
MKILKKILFVSLLLIITFFYWEAGVRIMAPLENFRMIYDKDVETVHEKNFSGEVLNLESNRKNYIVTNNMGFISNNSEPDLSSSTLRIAVLGGSMVEGWEVNYNQVFTNLLQESLNTSNACNKNIQVMNFGKSGASTFIEYQVYKKFVSHLKPNLVILAFSVNDNYCDYDINLNYEKFDVENFSAPTFFFRDVLSKSELIKRTIIKLSTNNYFHIIFKKFGIIQEANQDYGVGKISGVMKKPANYYTYTFDLIRKLKQKTTRDGAELLVLVLPNLSDYEKFDNWKNDQNFVSLIDFLNHEGVAAINPSNDLVLAKNKLGRCLTFNADCIGHLNEDGHRSIAKILYKYLINNYFSKKEVCQ